MEKLLPGEIISLVEQPMIVRPKRRLPALAALLRLLNIREVGEIGKSGPLIASTVGEENRGVGELRLYEAFFPRDAMYAAQMVFDLFPELLRTTLLRCAELQGVTENPKSEEEFGRIPHEVRDPQIDPIARKLSRELGWDWPYYGAVDNTPHFVALCALYVQRSADGYSFLNEKIVGRDGRQKKMIDAIADALLWIQRRRSANPEGFVESFRSNPQGHRNQVWMDSLDSYFHSDGTLANHQRGVASIEVQALTFDALLGAAEIYAHLGEADRSGELVEEAETLRLSILDRLWIEDGKDSFFALGGDRDGKTGRFRPFKIRKSNRGHLLASRLLDEDEPEIRRMVRLTVLDLLSKRMLAASGIRTCSTEELRFRPGAYHNGSVWPWDNYLIAEGMRKHGYLAESLEIRRRIQLVTERFNSYPEYVRGSEEPEPQLNERIVVLHDSVNGFDNVVEQPPQEIQAWTVAAVVAIEAEEGKLFRDYEEWVQEQKEEAVEKTV